MSITAADDFHAEPLTAPGSLADRVTAVLLQKIRGGEFPPGTRLPSEQVMAERFGVSRTVIREAVSRLKSEGLVETRQGSGAFVRQAGMDTPLRLDIDTRDSVQAVLRVIELRRGLESEMAGLAAERRSEAQLRKIERALEAIDKAVRAGRDGVEEDVAFHAEISRAAGNPLFTPLLKFLTHFLHDAVRVTRSNEARRADFARQVKAEHEAIVRAIAGKDPAAARAAARQHMEMAAARINAADELFWSGEGGRIARQLAKSEALTTGAGPKRRRKTR